MQLSYILLFCATSPSVYTIDMQKRFLIAKAELSGLSRKLQLKKD